MLTHALIGSTVFALVIPTPALAIEEVSEKRVSQIERELAAREYRASENGRGLQAPNRVHNLRIYFDERGITVEDRLLPGMPALAGLSLRGWGRVTDMNLLEEGTISYLGAKVEIERGEITEWYLNTPLGLEQGFDVSCRAAGEGALVLEMDITHARATLEGDSVLLITESGRELRYGKLLTKDAEGKTLASHFAVPGPSRVQLVIDDGEAIYPIVIDPLLTGAADFLLQSNQPDNSGFLPAAFGGSVASAGDVNSDGFDDIMVGAPGWDGGDPHEGAVFIFHGSATGLTGGDPTTSDAWLESNQGGAQFGTLSGAGDVNGDGYDDIIVGAHFYSDVLPGTSLEVNGAAFVFLGSAKGIVGTDPTTAHAWISANQLHSDLGLSVAGAGDINGDGFDDILVGAPLQGLPFPPNIPENQGSGNHGVVLVFYGSAAGITGTGFPDADEILLPFASSAPTTPLIGFMGASVAGAGDVNGDGFADIVVGPDVVVYLGSAGGIVGTDPSTAHAWIVSDQTNSALGNSVAAAGDINGDGFSDIIVGDVWYPARFTEHGAAYIFLGSASGIPATSTADAHALFTGSMGAEWLGMKVAGAGDIDGDGFDDVLMAARIYPGSKNSEGVGYVFRGSSAGIVGTDLGLDAIIRLETGQSESIRVGNVIAMGIAGAGDINGDGFSDVLLGAGYYDVDEFDEGAVFLYRGNPWPANPNLHPIANAGIDLLFVDLDGDGLESFTVDGRASYDPDGTIMNYTWLQGETVLGTTPILTTSLPPVGDQTLVLTVTDDQGITRGDLITVRVVPVNSETIFIDTFVNGLTNWTTSGSVTLDQTTGFPSPPHALMGSSPATLTHTESIPAGTTGMKLSFWGTGSQFAAGDQVLIKISVDGGAFTTFHTITAADSTGAAILYGASGIPLGHSWYPSTASSITVEFESLLTTGQFSVDDIVITAIMGPANPDADGDGTPDATDGCPLNPNKIAPGVCGCGVPDLDANGNGTMDCLEVACDGDITPAGPPVGNGVVNIDDLVAVLNGFGVCPLPPAGCGADITPSGGNGVVNIDDLVAVLNAFGLCP